MQLRKLLQRRTSVLAGPSGVGKSSIINALRFVALDDKQRARLARFEEAMATENDYRFSESDAESSSEEHSDKRGPQPVTSHGTALMSETDSDSVHAGAAERTGGTAASSVSQDAAGQGSDTAQAAWHKRSGNIYGAQVRPVSLSEALVCPMFVPEFTLV